MEGFEGAKGQCIVGALLERERQIAVPSRVLLGLAAVEVNAEMEVRAAAVRVAPAYAEPEREAAYRVARLLAIGSTM